MEVQNINVNIWMKEQSSCLELVQKDWDNIPLLNVNDVQNLQDKKLVRFQGMVQDMYNPEYYFEKYEVIDERTSESMMKNGKYLDTTEVTEKEVLNFDSTKNVTSERHTFVLISMPGLNKWVEDIQTTKYKLKPTNQPQPSPQKHKRALDDEPEAMDTTVTNATQSTDNKKQCTENTSSTTKTPAVSQDHLLNFPLPDRAGKSCHLKIYSSADTVKLNDLIECVGFLSVNPILSQAGFDSDDGDAVAELQTHHPPPSLIPRIHCVSFKKIENYNPFVDDALSMSPDTLQFMKKELHMLLTPLLLGDELAAEFFIYHLISKVYLRKDLMAIGKFSLNLSNVPVEIIPDYGEQLYKFIEELIIKSHYLPMTLDNMNDLSYIPKKDYDCNRITSGILQLSYNTHLVLDETKLTAGKLAVSGVRAVAAISSVIKNQKTPYDFNYYQMEFDCDIPFLVLSEGKSLLPTDIHIPLKIDEVHTSTFPEIVEAAKLYLNPELLDGIRKYLSNRRHADYELSDDIQELVESEFVKMRQDRNVTAEDLHSRLVLARLVCLAEGKAVLDEACWNKACKLEAERKERLPKN